MDTGLPAEDERRSSGASPTRAEWFSLVIFSITLKSLQPAWAMYLQEKAGGRGGGGGGSAEAAAASAAATGVSGRAGAGQAVAPAQPRADAMAAAGGGAGGGGAGNGQVGLSLLDVRELLRGLLEAALPFVVHHHDGDLAVVPEMRGSTAGEHRRAHQRREL